MHCAPHNSRYQLVRILRSKLLKLSCVRLVKRDLKGLTLLKVCCVSDEMYLTLHLDSRLPLIFIALHRWLCESDLRYQTPSTSWHAAAEQRRALHMTKQSHATSKTAINKSFMQSTATGHIKTLISWICTVRDAVTTYFSCIQDRKPTDLHVQCSAIRVTGNKAQL